MQGLASFSGYPIIGGTLTLSPGGWPSTAIISTESRSVSPGDTGPLILSFNGSPAVTLPNAAILPGSQYYVNQGTRLMRHKVVDGRWRWTRIQIGGRHNQRLADGEVPEDDKKTLQELFTILLDAAGETGYSFVGLPSITIPVDWVPGTSIADAVDSLCRRSGCSVSPDPNGAYVVYGPGSGPSLPTGTASSNASHDIDYSARPNILSVVMGDTIFQSNFKLVAVGAEIDGSLRKIVDLSYRPVLGWGSVHPETFAGLTGDAYYLARASVFRLYQIEELAEGGLVPPTLTDPATSIFQFELVDSLATSAVDQTTDRPASHRPSVVGTYLTENLVRENTAINTPYQGGFVIHKDRMLVEFERPVYRASFDQPDEADLYLKAAYRYRDGQGAITAHTHDTQLSPGNTVEAIRRPDLVRRIVQTYDPSDPTQASSVEDNEGEMDAEAAAHVATLSGQYTNPGKDVVFDGLLPLAPTGNVVQVRYDWGYGRQATTRASTVADFDLYTPSAEKRSLMASIASLTSRVLKE